MRYSCSAHLVGRYRCPGGHVRGHALHSEVVSSTCLPVIATVAASGSRLIRGPDRLARRYRHIRRFVCGAPGTAINARTIATCGPPFQALICASPKNSPKTTQKPGPKPGPDTRPPHAPNGRALPAVPYVFLIYTSFATPCAASFAKTRHLTMPAISAASPMACNPAATASAVTCGC